MIRNASSSTRVHTPNDEDELRGLIQRAGREGRGVRVIGSGHSVPDSIAEGDELRVSLVNLRGVLAYDATSGRIEVQAGIPLGLSPAFPEVPWEQTLLGFLQTKAEPGRAWALPGLGGITHQTVGGFLSTGCSGGSVRHAFGENVIAIRFMDARGNVHSAHRGDALFNALGVSLGLLGVILSVTFQCEPWFDVIGRVTTTRAADCEIDLFGEERGGLAGFLRETPFARLLWWPEPRVDRVSVWQARPMTRADYLAQRSEPLHLKARPTEPIGLTAQYVAGSIYRVLGREYGTTWVDRAVKRVVPWVTAPILDLFVPVNGSNPTLFWDTWYGGLPMDNSSSDRLMPTEFTELWIPIERTREVMIALRDHYRDNGLAATGTYACEIYAAKRSPFFLSPAYDTDVVRVDVFWFGGNIGDPVAEFYPQFWSLLKEFEFRPHWAKALPPANSELGAEYLRSRYPMWDDFMAFRAEFDPHGVFVTPYWREHLGLDSAGSVRHSTIVERAPAGPKPATAAERQSA